MSAPVKVVCLGGGWTALYAARAMRKAIRRGDIDLTVVSRDTFLTVHGFIAEMLAGRIQPNQIMAPARRIFRPARYHHAEVERVDLDRQEVTTSRLLDGREHTLAYDHLILGLGSKDDLGRYAGAQEHALRLRSYSDALKTRNHLIGVLEMADVETDPEERRRLLTFVVAGGGYGGIEVATEIEDYCRTVLKRSFPHIRPEEARVVVAHASSEVLPELLPQHANLQRYAARYLATTAIEFHPDTKITAATPEAAVLSDGQRIPTRTIISCTGMGMPAVIDALRLAKDERGRVVTDDHCRVPGAQGVWAAGDCAAVPHPEEGYCPPLAIYAMHAGRTIGRNLTRLVGEQPLERFTFTSFGDACSLGNRRAVAQLYGVPFYGTVAWVLWRIIFLSYVPSWDRRVRLLLDWLLTPFTGRELTQLRLGDPIGVSPELYEPGQVIVRQGDVGRRMHLVSRGEVEVVHQHEDGSEERLATLGAGDHFGEVSVFQGVRRTATVRAVSRVELLTLGEDVAVSLSNTAKPFGDAVRGRLAASGQGDAGTSDATGESDGPGGAPRTQETES
ncbi:MAG: FAD-dependent oxidoreductase [Egibacteraceae bacterium]